MPRNLTRSEMLGLASYFERETGDTREEVLEVLESYTTIAIDGYISDGPGYVGNLYIVIGSGGPELFQIFDKDFSPIDQCESMRC